jgi:pyruvate dehydrogenase E2 component (dihydrolipoamide acetyltransferase)
MTQEIRIPDIGDFDSVEVVEVLVAAGDEVSEDDPLIVIESDKASMEVPAGRSGIIDEVRVAVGDEVSEGDVIATVRDAADASASGTREPDDAEGADATPDAEDADSTPDAGAQEVQSDRAPEARDSDAGDDGASRSSSATVEVRVPDIGDAKDVVVIEVAVEPGDSVGPEDLLVVVESDKASMEIPAGQAGTVTAVHVQEGSEVEEGTLLATLEVAGEAPAARRSDADAGGEQTAPSKPDASTSAPPPVRAPAPAKGPSESSAAESPADSAGSRVYAGPAVRRLARELGVSLTAVSGTGNRGRILKDDVKAYVKKTFTEGGAAARGAGIPTVPAVDFAKFGPVEVVPMSRIRVAGAANLHRSWLNLPHVTQHEEADVTELEAFRASLKAEAERRGTKVTPLPFIVKACCHALKTFPTFNASLDPDVKNFILKDYFHIGFAVDTDDGLVVPVIRDADRLGIWELSEAILSLSEKAREKKLGMNDLQGGTFSISSLGNIGGTGFTPIINAPEVAILGVSRLVTKPVWNGSEFRPRQMLPLSLSYDHRAINGAEAGRFMTLIAELLSDIRRLAL